MPVLYGWQRKLALLPLAFFMVGWLLYAVGFIWILVEWPENQVKDNEHPSRDSSLNFPYYVSLVVAPIVYFFGVLFTVLPGIASGIVGIIVSFLSTFFFISAGWTVYESGRRLTYLEQNEAKLDLKLLFVFVGSLLEHLCWCLMLLLSVFYKYRKPAPDQLEFLPVEDENRQSRFQLLCFKLTLRDRNSAVKVWICLKRCVLKCQSKEIPFTPGIARLICIPFIMFSITGWCVFTVGFHRLFLNTDPESAYPFSFSASLIIPPLLFLSALLHAAFPGGTGKVMGELAALLYVPFVTFTGYILIDTGQYLHNLCGEMKEDGPWNEQDWMCYDAEDWSIHMHKLYIYAGGITALVFWSCVVSMWPFYRMDHPRAEDLELLTGNLRNTQTPIPELDLENPQQQSPTLYGSVQLVESYQGSFSNASQHLETDQEAQQLLQNNIDNQPHVESDVDNNHQHQEDQYDQEQQYQSDQNDQYHGDQYQENQLEYSEGQDQGNQYQDLINNDSQPLLSAERVTV